MSQVLLFIFSAVRFTYFNQKSPIIDSSNYLVIEKAINYVILEKKNVKYVYYDDKSLEKGNEILIDGIIEVLDFNNEFNKHLKTQNVYYLIKGKTIYNNQHRVLSSKIIDKLLENKDEFNKNILKLILFNQKDDTNKHFYEMFEVFSITFMLVISGFHINLLFKLFSKTKIIKYIVVFGYLYLLDFAISSYKAFLYYVLKKMKNRINIPFNNCDLLSIIMIVFLFINPSYCFNMGFIYSFGFSFLLDILNNTITLKGFKYSLLKKIIIYAASIPIMISNNYQINSSSLIVNLLFSYPISILFVFSFIYLFLDKFYLLYKIYVYIISKLLSLFIKYSKAIIIGQISYIFMIMLYACILLIIYCYQNKSIKQMIMFFVLYINILFVLYNLPRIDSRVYVEFINVGQGDCTIIKIKNTKKVIMIDTGGSLYKDVSNNIVIPHLYKMGINEIDTLIITHGDYDHMGASLELIENFKVSNVIFNIGEYNDLELDLIHRLKSKNINFSNAKETLEYEDLQLFFLKVKDYENENDNSIVVYTSINGVDILLMGDVSSKVENDLINIYDLSNIDILKVAHHGSHTSSSSKFISTIEPKYSIISVGKNNRYGHPNKEVLDNLNKTEIYRTDVDGNIKFVIYKELLEIITDLK